MYKYIATTLTLVFSLNAHATSTLEKNIVECTVNSKQNFEEIILKKIETQDADDNIFDYFVLDHTFGDLFGSSVEIFGRHEQVRHRLFTTANAEADGLLREGRRDFVMATEFEHSNLIINLKYVGQDQDDFPTYNMSFEGNGPAFDLVVKRVDKVLETSEHYRSGDDILCVTHFNLSDFVTQ